MGKQPRVHEVRVGPLPAEAQAEVDAWFDALLEAEQRISLNPARYQTGMKLHQAITSIRIDLPPDAATQDYLYDALRNARRDPNPAGEIRPDLLAFEYLRGPAGIDLCPDVPAGFDTGTAADPLLRQAAVPTYFWAREAGEIVFVLNRTLYPLPGDEDELAPLHEAIRERNARWRLGPPEALYAWDRAQPKPALQGEAPPVEWSQWATATEQEYTSKDIRDWMLRKHGIRRTKQWSNQYLRAYNAHLDHERSMGRPVKPLKHVGSADKWRLDVHQFRAALDWILDRMTRAGADRSH